ncbi:MAG: staygreen family protein [Dehalococcoidales bacterium]|nr:MAG: staygreen family protein [Dehalococcoidales bacterium]
MERLNPEKLHVTYLTGTTPESLVLPRRYTLTHSDISGKLFLSIGSDYDTRKTSKLYTRLMRDEVLAELVDEGEGPVFRVHCHVSGGFVFGRAKWRYDIFQSELPLVLEAIRYGDRTLFEYNPELDNSLIFIKFHSTDSKFDKVENWGTMLRYN